MVVLRVMDAMPKMAAMAVMVKVDRLQKAKPLVDAVMVVPMVMQAVMVAGMVTYIPEPVKGVWEETVAVTGNEGQFHAILAEMVAAQGAVVIAWTVLDAVIVAERLLDTMTGLLARTGLGAMKVMVVALKPASSAYMLPRNDGGRDSHGCHQDDGGGGTQKNSEGDEGGGTQKNSKGDDGGGTQKSKGLFHKLCLSLVAWLHCHALHGALGPACSQTPFMAASTFSNS
eukprot:7222308-Lingulodinium_polyedra.AAC.1